MTRYFENQGTGAVWRKEYVGNMNSSAWTEVQVVPLDAIVIRREDLPKVTRDGDGDLLVDGAWYSPHTPPEHREESARRCLAMALFAREHPPVDEAQVKALRDLIAAADDHDITKLARRLLATGRVEVKES